MIGSILVVDDSSAMQETLRLALSSEGYRVATAGCADEAFARMAEDEFDVVITDIVMPGVDGLQVLDRSRLLNPRAAVILMTGHPSVDTAVAALRRGACDYIEKPFRLDILSLRVRHLVQHREAIWREALRRRAPRPSAETLVGESLGIRVVRDQIARSARISSTVLITGESGVGKEVVARAVHDAGPRAEQAFIAVNCGAIPEALLESHLFGHVRGAFTSAVSANRGLFAAAAGGTLFLDEIGEMPLALQAKLLRVIEDKQVLPVGATKSIPVDVRIIASTNRDLVCEVADRRFREDLFYRLNVMHIEVPPLRERRGDIPLLVDYLLKRLNQRLGTRFVGIERQALVCLMDQPWRGNVRELQNAMERAMVLGSGEMLTLSDLSADLATASAARPRDLRGAVRLFERQHVTDVLAETHLDKRKAAHLLGISLASLYRKLSAGPDDDEPAQTA